MFSRTPSPGEFRTACIWTRKAEFNTADFAGLMPNTEHTLVLTFAQTTKTKRDGDFHRRLVVYLFIYLFFKFIFINLPTLRSGLGNGRYESYLTFKWICVSYIRVRSPHAHVFTIAALRSLSEQLDRPITPLSFLFFLWSDHNHHVDDFVTV